MKLIDTHAHIYVEEFRDNPEGLIQRAKNESVEQILMPAVDRQSHAYMLEMERRFPGDCKSMMGVHPCSVNAGVEEELEIAKKEWEKRRFIAVGEIGLDFYWDKTFTEQQYRAFHTQIGWALEYEVPIVIHSRNATDECIEVVKEYVSKGLRGVFHCFSGSVEQAEQLIDLGFYLGIGGVLTFKNAGLDKVVAQTGLDRLVLETDAPYLAPVPFRGKRNEPAYLRYVAARLSECVNRPLEEVAEVTTANAQKLFGI